MRTFPKITMIWLVILAGYVGVLLLFDHREVGTAPLLNVSIQALLFLITVFIYRKEPNKKNRPVFFNFLLFFFFSAFMAYVFYFVGKAIFVDSKYSSAYFFQYYISGYALFLSNAIVYLVIDSLFFDFKVVQKYLTTLAIVLAFFVWHFHPIFKDPKFLYTTEEIKQWKTLAAQIKPDELIPSAEELSKSVNLKSWREGFPIGELYPSENLKRISELLPYLEGENYKVLLIKPLYLNLIYMNVLVIGFMLLFFGYQYKKDPPQGAYIDKIVFTCLLFASTEVLHNWGYVKSIEWQSLADLVSIGQYITVVMLGVMAVFFGLRLKFITSVQGEFYETELAANPQTISRWRDFVDNIVIAKFFNIKLFHGRLFQQVTNK